MNETTSRNWFYPITAVISAARRLTLWLASVTAVPVGRDNDGLDRPIWRGGTEVDRSWGEQVQSLTDALEAWRSNPLARRLISLITAYTIGDGIRISSSYRPLAKFIRELYAHPLNNLELELPEWSDELSRSGELFLTLHTNPVDGMSYVRAIPASVIDHIETREGDYKVELRYRENAGIGNEVWWLSPAHPDAGDISKPLMLHYAVNRPVGAIRGIGDLDPILPWLRRYTRWLEDRVRLNAGVRAFLWVVKAAKNLKAELQERYRTPPEPGSIIIAEQGAEEWQAITPQLHATDAERDGRAIRWMIAAGGPGTALIDLGEGEDANQATGKVMQEQKRRFLRRRQRYLIYILSDLVLHAFARHRQVRTSLPFGEGRGGVGRPVSMADLIAHAPDISPEDNKDLASATASLTDALATVAELVGDSDQFRRMALRLFSKFVGEQLPDEEFEAIITTGQVSRDQTSPSPTHHQSAGQHRPVHLHGARAHPSVAPTA